jgi:glycosyltransferase involved in cell wall biosynthesis
MRIAYLINQYPKISHSFIRREIAALERRGLGVLRVAVRGWNEDPPDDADRQERERTRYVLAGGAPALLLAALHVLATRPARFAQAAMLTWRMSVRADRPLPIHLVYLMEACRVALWLRAENIEHLHAHFGTNSAEVAMLVHVLGGPRWSFTIHGPEEFDKAPVIGLAEKLARCSFVVAVSLYGRSQIYRLLAHEHWDKVHVVRCGLESVFFEGAAVLPAPNVHRLVCVGRLCEQKGQLLLVEAAHRLAAQGTQFELVLVGDGEMRSQIEALIARRSLQARVRITGWISNAKVGAEILAARAMVLPSFAEGLPVVLMEAMALGRPVISTFVAGIPELVQPGENGWLVPAGEIDALVEAMRDCLDQPADRLAAMGASARDRVSARHRADVEAGKLARLFSAAERREVPAC